MVTYDENIAADYRDEDPGAELASVLPPPVNWWLLSDEERSLHLGRVTNFTLRLVESYSLGVEVVPPCWHLHSELVQELLALTQYRNDQQFIASQAPGAALDFHERFAMWKVRMRSWVSEAGCKGNEHVARLAPAWVVQGTPAFTAAEKSRIDLQGDLVRGKG